MEGQVEEHEESENGSDHSAESMLSLPETLNTVSQDEQNFSPMFGNMELLENRKESFNHRLWKKHRNLKNFVASDEIFSKAGFFYGGFKDQITCFYCGGTLEEIESTDQPVREHMKYYPSCEYLVQEYSAAAISLMKEKFMETSRPLPRDHLKAVYVHLKKYVEDSYKFLLQVEHNPEHLPQPEVGEVKLDKLLAEAMSSEPVSKILNMGFDREQVKSIMERKIQKDNCYYETLEKLLYKLIPDD